MSASSRPWSELLALVTDNAVARKDALVLTRQRSAVMGLVLAFVATLLVAGVGVLVIFESFDATLYRNYLFPHGRTLTASVALIALMLTSLLVPALASTTVAAERESGTLQLLLTTALTPGRIVLGKLLAVLHGVAAPLVLALPLLASGALFAAVSLVDVLFCASLLAANVVALASVGVAASATSERVRVAPGKALGFAALFVWVPMGIPSVGLVVLWASEGYHAEMLPIGALALAWFLVIVSGALLIARDAIAPSTAIAHDARRKLVAFTLVGTPLLAAVSLLGLRAPVDLNGWGTLYLVGFGGLALVVIVGQLALAPPSGRGAWQAAARSAWLSTAGALVAWPVASLCLRGRTNAGVPIDQVVTPSVAFGAVVPALLWLTIAGGLAAVFARRTSSPLWRTVGTAMVLAVVFGVVPALVFATLAPPATAFLVDPAHLIATATGSAIRPFDARGADVWILGAGAQALVWLLLLASVCALALRERARERVHTRR